MHWVLQTNLFEEQAFSTLVDQLERQGHSYSIVKIIPFTSQVEPDVNPDGDIYVCGSTSIGRVARAKGWWPGYFDSNLEIDNLLVHYGNRMLNHDTRITSFKDATKVWDRFFIRPINDRKQFAGMVMSWDEFEEWREKIIDLGENSQATIDQNDMIVMAPVRDDIFGEFRFFVVDGKVITGSRYKLGGKVIYSSEVDESIYEFARQMVDLYSPDRAFVIDIAQTSDGFKVIECNSINSSGFYACDMGKYVAAISAMEKK